jgi:hypothetical protein
MQDSDKVAQHGDGAGISGNHSTRTLALFRTLGYRQLAKFM